MRRLVNRHPGRGGAWVLGALPFVLLAFVYVIASQLRSAQNADDKLLPTPSVLADTIHDYAFEEDSRSGSVLLWLDTGASLKRLVVALALAAAIGLVFGVATGVIPVIIRDLALRAGELPAEQLIKAQTLGASTWQLIVRVVLPQIWPRLIDSLRLTLGSAWLFLIAAEAIASTEGLGYR